MAFRLVRARIEAGDLAGAAADLDRLAGVDPFDWRIDWYRGLAALAATRVGDARVAFDAVYDQLPGEPAARLALAAAVESTGDRDLAERLYDRVWRTDRGFISAAFGLARLRLAKGGRTEALRVLDQVPDSSSHHLAAQVAAVRANLPSAELPGGADELLAASARLQRLGLDVERQARLTVEMLEASLAWLGAGHVLPPQAQVLGEPAHEKGLRLGLERAYRILAQLATDPPTRIALVDRANAVRPRTLT